MTVIRFSSAPASRVPGTDLIATSAFKEGPIFPSGANVANTAAAIEAFDAYAAQAKATGLPCQVSMRLGDGERAPRGFRDVPARRFVNV